jgi:ferritin-like metal-binding protein YciE
VAKEKTLDDLFYDTLKDIYYAEKKILKELPKMARGAKAPDLKAAFEKHREETEGHLSAWIRCSRFSAGGQWARHARQSMESLRKARILDEFKGAPALDAGLLAAAQAV